ncbi:MAG: hypothetical protein ACI85F_000141 [Bacteroidia bacterium]
MPTCNSIIMKVIYKLILPILAALVMLFSTGCDDISCFSVTGDVVDRPYSIGAISGLRMFCEGTVYLAQGDSQSVVLRSDEELFKVLQFHITNGVLIMDFTEDCVEHIGEFKLYIITTEDFKSIDLRSSGTVKALDSLRAPNLSINVAGSGGVELQQVYSDSMDLQITGSGNISLTGPDTLMVMSNMVSGTGNIQAFNLISRDVSVDGSGSGNINVHVVDTLHGSITGSGNLNYKGQPGVDVSVTGSGNLIDAN